MPDSVHYQCLTAIKSEIDALITSEDLTGIETDEVVVRRKFADDRQVYPGYNICLADIVPGRGTNESDDHGYGCLLVISRTNNADLTDKIDQDLNNRQTIRRYFLNQRLTGVSEVYIVKIEEGDALDKKWLDRDYNVAPIMLRCWARESRGLS